MEVMKYNPPELFAFGQTAKIIEEGDENKIFPRMLQRQIGISAKDMGIEIRPLKVNDISTEKEIKINSEFTFHIYHTPGHSFGSVCYYEPTKRILIPGDLVFTGGNFGRYDFPGSSLEQLQNSIKNMNELDVKYLLPGHMGISENGNEQIQLSCKIVMSLKDYL
jgi:glyoxylase-like metal-dependent hydrolase (beta-lactamase superfamily II)